MIVYTQALVLKGYKTLWDELLLENNYLLMIVIVY